MKILIKALLLGVFALQIVGCYKDKGNYNYHNINQPVGAVLDTAYTFFLGTDSLKITPHITWSQDSSVANSSRYTYSWETLSMTSGLSIALIRKDLSYSRNLDTVLSLLTSGDYHLYYKIYDNLTGVKWQEESIIHVKSNVYQGWLLLNDLGGRSRLDMISERSATNWVTMIDVLSMTNAGIPDSIMNAAPQFIACWKAKALATTFVPTYGITLSTAKGTIKLDPETFAYNPYYALSYEFAGTYPNSFYGINFLSPASYTSYLMGNDTNVYSYYNTYGVNYGIPINIVTQAPDNETTPFRTSKYWAVSQWFLTNYPVCLFDKDKRRFVMGNENSASCVPLTATPGTYFDFNHVGKDLVWMTFSNYAITNGSGTGNIYAILKDTAASNYYFTCFTFASPNFTQNKFQVMSPSSVPGINAASNFCVSTVYNYVFYSVGGKVYSYDQVSNTSTQMLDYGTSTISLMQFDQNNNLQVFASDPANPVNSGVFDTYTVNPVQSPLTLTQHFGGLGRVVSASFRSRS